MEAVSSFLLFSWTPALETTPRDRYEMNTAEKDTSSGRGYFSASTFTGV